MSRRVSKIAVAAVVLSLFLSSPSFAARRAPEGPSFDPGDRIVRIVRAVKKFVRGLNPAVNDDVYQPTTPRP